MLFQLFFGKPPILSALIPISSSYQEESESLQSISIARSGIVWEACYVGRSLEGDRPCRQVETPIAANVGRLDR
jgi:hypothetical protein